ncbi:MAG: hypothetical protein LBD91_07820 [Prevotellaceae bacterium]|jgi:hypothetical protein|nr:hypothetical protein [Prevotellaceae bacterium]
MKKILLLFALIIFLAASYTLTGKGGSMARFTIKDDVLYVVDNETLKLFDILSPVILNNGVRLSFERRIVYVWPPYRRGVIMVNTGIRMTG